MYNINSNNINNINIGNNNMNNGNNTNKNINIINSKRKSHKEIINDKKNRLKNLSNIIHNIILKESDLFYLCFMNRNTKEKIKFSNLIITNLMDIRTIIQRNNDVEIIRRLLNEFSKININAYNPNLNLEILNDDDLQYLKKFNLYTNQLFNNQLFSPENKEKLKFLKIKN